MEALIDKKSFLGLDECTFLYCGAESPPHSGGLEAVKEYYANRGKGPIGREKNAEVEASCKRSVARLLGIRDDRIAFMSNSSEAISMIAQSLDLKPGDNVVINTLEFPSGVLPWLLLKAKGVEVRVVPHVHWQVQVEDTLARVDERTRLVIASHVSYQTGARFDYKSLYDQLRRTGTLFLLDATQSLGAVPVDASFADFVVCSSYKWLLSTHGLGILAVNPERVGDVAPSYVGWRSVEDMFSPTRFESFRFQDDARKFELGYPSYPTIYSLNYSTELLNAIGVENIERHILSLGGLLIEDLKWMGYEVMTPENPSLRAGNISFLCEDGEETADRLRKDGIYVWGGDGRVRASLHLYNDSLDVNRFVGKLNRVVQP